MFWLGVLMAEMAVLIGLCVFTEGYAAIRLFRNRVFLLGDCKIKILDCAELWQDMKTNHCLSGLMSREQYERFCKGTQASGRAGKFMDFKRF